MEKSLVADSKANAENGDRHLQSYEIDNPALIHRPFVLMEELLEKLRLVNYDVDFCHASRYKPISRWVGSSAVVKFLTYIEIC